MNALASHYEQVFFKIHFSFISPPKKVGSSFMSFPLYAHQSVGTNETFSGSY